MTALSLWFEPPYAIVGWAFGITIAAGCAVVVGNKFSGWL